MAKNTIFRNRKIEISSLDAGEDDFFEALRAAMQKQFGVPSKTMAKLYAKRLMIPLGFKEGKRRHG